MGKKKKAAFQLLQPDKKEALWILHESIYLLLVNLDMMGLYG